MELEEYIQQILANRRFEKETSPSSLQLVEEALSSYPDSAKLYCIKGDMIQLSSEDCPYELSDALACYEKAIEIDQDCAEAYESIGYYFDVIQEDFSRSEENFRKALDIEESEDSYVGLARVMAQQGTNGNEITEMLDGTRFRDGEEIQKIRNEIIDGLWN